MLISVIVCTYGRRAAVSTLLACLPSQTHRDFEVLLVAGDGEDTPSAAELRLMVASFSPQIDVRLLFAPKGLTRQRNYGLSRARGELLCFLDDDVTFEKDFLAKAAELFELPGMQDLGGASAY
ncbi:MAG: glycosyl transferase, family 2, partial [Bryobacterales bacterium]|nr:glycosyl transferase, family 2 [Bryobacterales bacterium]